MPSDNNTLLLANLLLAQQGEEAWQYATAKRRKALLAQDQATAEKWFDILKALKSFYMQDTR